MIILPYFRGRKSAGPNRNQMRVFAFNVTSIPRTESIVAAELRLNGLRNMAIRNELDGLPTNTSDTRWTAVIAVYRLSNRRNAENNTRNVRRLNYSCLCIFGKLFSSAAVSFILYLYLSSISKKGHGVIFFGQIQNCVGRKLQL